jgi:hypothetical protein
MSRDARTECPPREHKVPGGAALLIHCQMALGLTQEELG